MKENPPAPPAAPADRTRQTVGWMLLFGTMYFVQGIAEPTEGLIAQPVRSLLRSWGYKADLIGEFIFFLSLPWIVKPLYGLLTDFVPLGGARRRSYLLLASGVTVLALIYLYWFPPERGQYAWLLGLLLAPTVGVAFSDVVVDALMVEKGQPLGLTGRLQAVQWTALSVAGIGAAQIGGYLSERGAQPVAFAICAAVTAVTFVLAYFYVREERQPRHREGEARWAVRQLVQALRTRGVLAAAAFLFLWTFNPFTSSSVLYTHMTDTLQIKEAFYAHTQTATSVGEILASLAYGFYCRRVPLRWLIHGAIVAGIAGTVLYAGLAGPTSLLVISFLVGFTYMTGSLVQLDVAARACPVAAAGSVFALLMSVSNLAMSLAELAGGALYVHLSRLKDESAAFQSLVVLGALTTCGCWLVVPLLTRGEENASLEVNRTEEEKNRAPDERG